MKPKVDFVFKEIMADEKARTGFLSAVLRIHPENIKETRILNTNLRREHEDDKQGILDVRLLLNDDAEIDIDYSDFRFIPINLLREPFHQPFKQIYRNNCFNSPAQVGQ